MPKFFVTGASGFVGSHVVRRLVIEASGAPLEVHCLARSDAAASRIAAICPHAHIHRGDLSNVERLKRQLEGCDTVINCAALYRWWAPDPRLFEAANVEAVQALLDAAQAAGMRRFVQVSTVLAFGKPPGCGSGQRPLTPDMEPGRTVSRYAASKARGDALVLEAAARAQAAGAAFGACVVQLACVVGADPKLLRPQEDTMRMADLVQGKVPATVGHSTVFTYVHVKDAAGAIVRAARAGRPGARYFVGRARLTTDEYYSLIERLSGAPAPRARIPLWMAQLWAALSALAATHITGRAPQAPPDLISTVVHGTLLFDSSSTDRELGLEYRPIREAFQEAVDLIKCSPT